MKLVEILARELEKWPAEADMAVQDIDGQIKMAHGDKPAISSSGKIWVRDGEVYHDIQHRSRELSEDHATAIVTRADWEAERAKLKAPKANGDGWVRHRGGKCPVEADVVIEYRERCGNISIEQKPQHLDTMWSHDGSPHDIMAYKIHKPSEQTAEDDLTRAPKPAPSLAQRGDTMLAIRDRIRELDTQREEVEELYQRQISEITQERESLVKRLAGEGLALVEVVVQPVEDMSDWRNWRAGDVLECIGSKSSHFTNGLLYKFVKISFELGSARAIDNRGIENGLLPKFFKWHSRPAT